MPYFDESVGRVKIQTTSKNLSAILFSQNSNLSSFLTFTRPVGIRRVQISHDICTRFARYLYFTKQSWIISNGYRTEWSPIGSVIIQVKTKSDDRAAGVRFVYREYDYRPNWTTRNLITN